MAFSGISSPTPTALQILLEEIKFQQQKEVQHANLQKAGSFYILGTTYWTDVFVRFFLFQKDRTVDCDDLLFFVRRKHDKVVSTPKFQTEVEVFRKDSKKLPIGDPEIIWKDTVFLNLLIHQLEYTLTLAICTRCSPKDLQVLKRHSQKVYASPSRRRMDTKGDFEEMTFPNLNFMVDNFSEAYSEIFIREGELVCVELIAADRDQGFQSVLFLGSIRYDALKRVFDARASLGSKMAQCMTFGMFSGENPKRVEYVRLKGPYGKGHAEVAVSKPKGVSGGCETPSSEPGFSLTDGLWDDSDNESEDLSVFKHQRRLSDPSYNLNNYARSGWKTMKGNEHPKRCRSQNQLNEADDLTTEIMAGDVRDDAVVGDLWCCGCCGFECGLNRARSRNVSGNGDETGIGGGGGGFSGAEEDQSTCGSGSNRSSSSCYCCCPTPFPRSQSIALDILNANPDTYTKYNKYKDKDSNNRNKLNSDSESKWTGKESNNPSNNKTSQEESYFNRKWGNRPPLVSSKTVTVPSIGERLKNIMPPKSNSIACLQDAKQICRNKLLKSFPNKMTSTGVIVLYLCDEDKKKIELDDGAYNPLWSMRGFTQTFHYWRESRRNNSVPLNAFLTYITLPINSIMKDVLESREEPVLTF